MKAHQNIPEDDDSDPDSDTDPECATQASISVGVGIGIETLPHAGPRCHRTVGYSAIQYRIRYSYILIENNTLPARSEKLVNNPGQNNHAQCFGLRWSGMSKPILHRMG